MPDIYLNKATLTEMIKKLPITEDGLISKERVLKCIDFLPEEEITTKLRRNRNSEIYCQSCESIIRLSALDAALLAQCPFCELKIKECKFDNK